MAIDPNSGNCTWSRTCAFGKRLSYQGFLCWLEGFRVPPTRRDGSGIVDALFDDLTGQAIRHSWDRSLTHRTLNACICFARTQILIFSRRSSRRLSQHPLQAASRSVGLDDPRARLLGLEQSDETKARRLSLVHGGYGTRIGKFSGSSGGKTCAGGFFKA